MKFHPAVRILLWLTLLGITVALLSLLFNRFMATVGEAFLQPVLDNPLETFAIYFLLAAVATIIIPLPTFPMDILLMQLFNPYLVVMVRIAASLAGSSISFLATRRYGGKFLKRFLSASHHREVVAMSERVTPTQFLAIALFPLVNPELIGFAAGLSRITLANLLWIMIPAQLYRLLIVVALV